MRRMRPPPQDFARNLQGLEALLASGALSAEATAVLGPVVDTFNEIKRELLKQRPSMERIKKLTADSVAHLKLHGILRETEVNDEGEGGVSR